MLVLIIAFACAAAALGVAYLLIPAEARALVLPVVAFAIVVRIAAAVALHDGLLAAGKGGFVTGDDAVYADVSWRLAQILHGDAAPFNYSRESHLLNTFVYLEAAVFYVLGPKVVVVEILNAVLGGLLVVFVFDIARRLFSDPRPGIAAATLVSVYPSLVVWSALNLIDSLALFLIAVVLWILVLFQTRPTWWLVPASFAPLFLMESLRDYIFLGLALVIPASVLLAPGPGSRNRIVVKCLAVALAALMLIGHATVVPLLPSPLATEPRAPSAPVLALPSLPSLAALEEQSFAMGTGANTNFAAECARDSTADAVTRTLRRLPCAAAYVLFAPFPWTIRRVLDVLPIPEMLVWYVALVGGTVVVIRRRRSWRSLVPLLLFIGGTLGVFLLAEGNVGTLFRHRAMVIPFVIIIASPAFAYVVARPRARTVQAATSSS